MKFDTEHGIQALYKEAQGQYTEHWFSTVRRDFVIDPQLINPSREFKLDTTFLMVPRGWIEHPTSDYKTDVLPLELTGQVVAGDGIEPPISRLWA